VGIFIVFFMNEECPGLDTVAMIYLILTSTIYLIVIICHFLLKTNETDKSDT